MRWWTLLVLALAGSVSAQYPARPIEMIVPIAPGGGMDLQARLLAELVEPDLGQRVVVLNRPGAGGTMGVKQLAQAKPDGYTIAAVWSGPLTASPHSQPVQYTPDDYVPVVQFSKAPFVLCTAPDFPAATGAELVANIKQNPDKYSYGHEGIGGTLHLGAERVFPRRPQERTHGNDLTNQSFASLPLLSKTSAKRCQALNPFPLRRRHSHL